MSRELIERAIQLLDELPGLIILSMISLKAILKVLLMSLQDC